MTAPESLDMHFLDFPSIFVVFNFFLKITLNLFRNKGVRYFALKMNFAFHLKTSNYNFCSATFDVAELLSITRSLAIPKGILFQEELVLTQSTVFFAT